MDFESERNNEIMKTYNKLVRESDFLCLEKLCKELVNHPTTRFWVSEERAAIVLSKMMRGEKLKGMRPTKKEMFKEIFRRAMALRKKHPEWSALTLAFKVVCQPAPKFYISPSYAKGIIHQTKKKWFEERRRKLRHLF